MLKYAPSPRTLELLAVDESNQAARKKYEKVRSAYNGILASASGQVRSLVDAAALYCIMCRWWLRSVVVPVTFRHFSRRSFPLFRL